MAACPLNNFSWVIQGVLAGSARPESDADINFLRAAGFKTIVTLTEDPRPRAAELTAAASPFRCIHIPVVDRTVPTLSDFDKMSAVATDSSNWPIIAHCAKGIGRTAFFLLCGFVSLWLRQDEPRFRRSFVDLRHIYNAAGDRPLTASGLISMLKLYREVNVPEPAVADMITRLKLAAWAPLTAGTTAPASSIAGPCKPDLAWETDSSFEHWRSVIAGICSTSSLPPESMSPENLVKAWRNAGSPSIILNIEPRSFTTEQLAALQQQQVRVVDVPIKPGTGPTLAQMTTIAQLFLERRNINSNVSSSCYILVTGGRGRAGTAIAVGVRALRCARDPHFVMAGRSVNDLTSFVRGVLGPFAIDGVDQERALHRFTRAVQLHNFNTVIDGVLCYSAAPATTREPTLAMLAIRSRDFASVVSLREKKTKEDDELERLLLSSHGGGGVLFHHIPVVDGLVPSRTDALRFFDLVRDPNNWPMLLVSDNGYARCITMAAAGVLALRSDEKAVSLLGDRLPQSTSQNPGETKILFKLLQKYEGENATTLTAVTQPQRNFVQQAAKYFYLNDNTAAAAAAAELFDEHPGADTEIVTRALAFGDWGAELTPDCKRQQDGLELFARALAEEVRTTDRRPDCFLSLGDLTYWNGNVKPTADDAYLARWRKVFLGLPEPEDKNNSKEQEEQQRQNHQKVLRGIPWKHILGNHDRRTPADVDPELLKQPGYVPGKFAVEYTNLPPTDDANPGGVWQFRGNDPKEKPSHMYTFRYPQQAQEQQGGSSSVAFIAFDTNVSQPRVRREVPSLVTEWNQGVSWLASQLDKSQDALWRIVFQHHPLYTLGLGHAPEGLFLREGFTDTTSGQVLTPIEPLLNEKNCDLLLVGHEHELSCKVRGGLVQVLSGAVMENSRYGRTQANVDSHRLDWEADRFVTTGFTRITVFHSKSAQMTRLLIEFVRVPDLVVIHSVSMVKDLSTGATNRKSAAASQTAAEPGLDDDDTTTTTTPTTVMARCESTRIIGDGRRNSDLPAIIIVNYPTMLETMRSAGLLDRLKQLADVFTFTNTAAAMAAVAQLRRRRTHIAGLVTNMRRVRPTSGINCIESLVRLSQELGFGYSVPAVMFSWTASKNPEPSFAAGAFTIFHTNLEMLQAQLVALAEAARWFSVAASLVIKRKQMLQEQQQREAIDATTTTWQLAASHCMLRMPTDFGGRIQSLKAQEVFFSAVCAMFEKLVKPLSKAVLEEVTSLGLDAGGYFLLGEAAAMYYSHLARGGDYSDARGRATVFDLAVASENFVTPLLRRIARVVDSAADLLRGYFAHCGMRVLPASSSVDQQQQQAQQQTGEGATSSVASVKHDRATGAATIYISLLPCGPFAQYQSDDNDPTLATRPTFVHIARIHVRDLAGSRKNNALPICETEDGTRFCPGLYVLTTEALLQELADNSACQQQQRPYLGKRPALLEAHLRNDVVPRL